MKYYVLLIHLVFYAFGFSQIAHYNQFPSLAPKHILDDKLTDISFAFSMRILESDYNGPLIRLRRNSDNQEQDFFCASNDIVDIAAINAWRGSDQVFVVTWYDQSGLGRNAIQNTENFQPEFITSDPTRPYFVGDGANDRLDVNTSIQTLTNVGINGTVFITAYATDNNQFTFGTRQPGNNTNRWSVHLNWTDDFVYFDSGICCDAVRRASNTNNEWQQFSFVRANIVQSIRKNGTILVSGNYTNGRCTATNNFGILYSNGNNRNFADNRITELIMYRMEVTGDQLIETEENQINFWNI